MRNPKALVARTQAAAPEHKPYHHGDLRRALLSAAEAILEREGPAALTLRAAAREAGVSPAAPYHHFTDKDELLLAVGRLGFDNLKQALAAVAKTVDRDERPFALGMAYVAFAQAHPALYRVMYDCARRTDAMPSGPRGEGDEGGFHLIRDAIGQAAGKEMSEIDVYLAAIASWCAVHGLAEMSGFAEFRPLKEAMGGEQAFLRGVLDHMSLNRRPRT
jgi:AcrR family transcriptional regulator